MQHIIFEESNAYSVALLIKNTSFNKSDIEKHYVEPLIKLGLDKSSIIAISYNMNGSNKAPAKFVKEQLDILLPILQEQKTTHIYITDSSYFKVLTGVIKSEPHHGYSLPCKIKGYEHMHIVLGINHQALIYNPEVQSKLDLGLNALASSVQGTYTALGNGIIHSASYPQTLEAIEKALEQLHQYPSLTCDIEGFSLRFEKAGIGTIAFAWDQHNGIAFPVDYYASYQGLSHQDSAWPGSQIRNEPIRKLLKKFFETYKGEITYHSATYDVKILIYELWMKDLLDTEGLLTGLDIMTARIHDTKIIAYLATNTTAGNVLGLKALAHEFAGNWAKEDIKDIRKIPLPELLQYNLVDALSTHYVRNKYSPIMVRDNQLELYESLMLPSMKLILQIELTGMPLNPEKVKEVKKTLEGIQQIHLDVLHNSNVIKAMNLLLQVNAMEAANAKLKVKQHPLEKFKDVAFNPNSGPQLQKLLYEQMGLPVIDLTDKKMPATGGDTLKKLINHTDEPAYKDLINALIGYSDVTKILNTFIPAFEEAVIKGDGITWLHGNFNLGGTVSGRLSSSDPYLLGLHS